MFGLFFVSTKEFGKLVVYIYFFNMMSQIHSKKDSRYVEFD